MPENWHGEMGSSLPSEETVEKKDSSAFLRLKITEDGLLITSMSWGATHSQYIWVLCLCNGWMWEICLCKTVPACSVYAMQFCIEGHWLMFCLFVCLFISRNRLWSNIEKCRKKVINYRHGFFLDFKASAVFKDSMPHKCRLSLGKQQDVQMIPACEMGHV